MSTHTRVHRYNRSSVSPPSHTQRTSTNTFRSNENLDLFEDFDWSRDTTPDQSYHPKSGSLPVVPKHIRELRSHSTERQNKSEGGEGKGEDGEQSSARPKFDVASSIPPVVMVTSEDHNEGASAPKTSRTRISRALRSVDETDAAYVCVSLSCVHMCMCVHVCARCVHACVCARACACVCARARVCMVCVCV